MDFLEKYFKYENGTITCGLTEELNVFYILGLYKKLKRNIIVLTATLYEANQLYNLFQNYTENVLIYPCDDFISSMKVSASPELKLIRLNTLNKINSGSNIIITNLNGFLKYIPTEVNSGLQYINLTKNNEYKRDDIINQLSSLGYRRESLTTSTGEFSIRGMIIDVYPINEKHPYRIEFDDNIISDIRQFDEENQTSIISVDKLNIKPVDEIKSNNNTSLYFIVDNPIVVYIDKPQIDASYLKLSEDICEYESINEDKVELMKLEDININFELTLNKFAINKSDVEITSHKLDNFNQDFELLEKQYNKWKSEGKNIIFFLSSKKEIDNIKSIFSDAKIINKKINNGFILGDNVFISEYDIENIKREYKYQNNLYGGKKIIDYNDLNKGDYIVHVAHGIGVYNGIVTLTKNGIKKDYIQILYMGNDKIYVPVEKITNIYKYSDKDGTIPKLNRLNSTSWLKTRSYVRKKIEDISKELIDLYQKRSQVKRKPYKSFEEEIIFDNEFTYNLTKDQQKAINDLNNDLESSSPMDRLLCGDVGFGKTEVAMRAIFKSVLNNNQVVYLCPTTILSSQQYNVIKNRMSSWPIEVALINRFTTKKELDSILDKLEKGIIDVVVGTHKLLNKDIKYRNLGLLIIDEEQRFGVKHKELIKELKNNIDVLTLSATPIPRTLKMAMSGLRDLSIIDTAPSNRYPVQTYVINEDEYIIKDAIYKEIARGGQVFILFNSVENIENKTDEIRRLVPNEDVRFAHGQMNKDDLESIMYDFTEGKFNILVCTTIIESGIDIPNANTLIVYNADHLGLAQLYQLRGRVGRADKIAYAYLLYNKNKMLNDSAIKRLQAIKEFTALGSGYRIAMRDLSIRGSGDVFGSSQAGFVDSVGISLYTKMLEDELKRQKGEYVEEDEEEKTLFNIDTHIDDSYISDEDIKIEVHKLINTIDTYDKLNEVKLQLEDRFGKITEEIENYMYDEWFEKIAKKLNITNVVQTDRYIEITLPEELCNEIKGDKLLYSALNISHNFNIAYKNKCIKITLYYKNLEKHFIRYVVQLLSTL